MHDRRRRRPEATAALSDDEATPLADLPTGPGSGSADTLAQPVAAATPVAPPRPVPTGPAGRGPYDDLGDVT